MRLRYACLATIAVCFGGALAGLSGPYGIVRVFGDSMNPTLHSGDYVLVERNPFVTRQPARGDVVVIRVWHRGQSMIKRLIAVEGDTVEARGGAVLVNGTASSGAGSTAWVDPPGDWHYSYLSPRIALRTYQPTAGSWGPLIVPSGSFFVIGDNRQRSGDSRQFGFVRLSDISAQAVWILVSFPARHRGRLRIGMRRIDPGR
jgi:signal peptidase I